MRRGVFVLALCAPLAMAQAPAKKVPAPDNSPRPEIVRPVELMKCKPKGPKEEAKVRDAAEAANFSDHEVFARLIFSEAISTGFWEGNCTAPNSTAVLEGIAWGIINRVDKYSPKRDDPKPDAFFHVIFAQKMFRTSFAAKDNPYSELYLCPLKYKKVKDDPRNVDYAYAIYNEAKEVASRVMDKYQRNGIEAKYSGITHFFYPYSNFGGKNRPAWAKDPVPANNKGYMDLIPGEKPCVEFYRR